VLLSENEMKASRKLSNKTDIKKNKKVYGLIFSKEERLRSPPANSVHGTLTVWLAVFLFRFIFYFQLLQDFVTSALFKLLRTISQVSGKLETQK